MNGGKIAMVRTRFNFRSAKKLVETGHRAVSLRDIKKNCDLVLIPYRNVYRQEQK